jgi:hypothetical protein
MIDTNEVNVALLYKRGELNSYYDFQFYCH